MSKKDQLEKDYKKFNIDIEHEAENELKKIKEESDALKKEAGEIGEAVERSINRKPPKQGKKKVIT
jgi:hypothetical protein